MYYDVSDTVLLILSPIVSIAPYIWLWRKFSPPTVKVKKLKFFLVFFSSLSIIAFFPSFVVPQFMPFVIVIGGGPAILTALISLLLKLYVFKKSQIPWFVSTVLVGYVASALISIFMIDARTIESILFGAGSLFLGACGATCSFCSALVLTVFPKSKQNNNE